MCSSFFNQYASSKIPISSKSLGMRTPLRWTLDVDIKHLKLFAKKPVKPTTERLPLFPASGLLSTGGSIYCAVLCWKVAIKNELISYRFCFVKCFAGGSKVLDVLAVRFTLYRQFKWQILRL